jgi:hypothetical protein
MSVPSHPQLSLQEISTVLGTPRHLQEIIKGVWLDCLGEKNELLPQEATQLHLRRETVALDRQIERALTRALGDNSRQLGRLREIGFAPASSRSLIDVQLLVDSYIADLQRRLELLRASANSPRPEPVMQDSLHAERPDKGSDQTKGHPWKCSTSVKSCGLP